MANRILKLFISLCFSPFLLVWRGFSSLARGDNKPPHVILLYHQVPDEERERFAAQMDDLVRIGDPTPLDKPATDSSRRLQISVTFDDGVRDFIRNALPALAARNVPATLFFPTDYFGRFPDWISGQDPEDESRWIMSVEEARSLPSNLIGVGSHTVGHRRLSRLSEEEIQRELVQSKTDLEAIFKRTIDSIAYPHGDYDPRVVQATEKAGYKRAYAADPVWTEGMVVGRVNTGPSDWPLEFRLKARGAYSWLPIAFFLKRLLKSGK